MTSIESSFDASILVEKTTQAITLLQTVAYEHPPVVFAQTIGEDDGRMFIGDGLQQGNRLGGLFDQNRGVERGFNRSHRGSTHTFMQRDGGTAARAGRSRLDR